MFGEKHDLIHELPEHKERIHQLKISDEYFAKLFEEYHELDHEILRMEEGIETPSDDVLEELKKKRLYLKDQLFSMIIAA
ncbi:MAG: DUF465 domain-containing protein [Gammaproteobacteria bacterium]|nr:DUF465 domain-containing protein [Gammaproteobacteria bacterium]NNJ96889.1 DUF465 domain-containing protein [Gammaproteobacteria bacterium]